MLKVTVPVGVPAPGDTATTRVVNVTDEPNVDGLSDELTVAALLAGLTVWMRSEVVPLPLKLASPVYAALIVWLPAVANALVRMACPEALTVTLVGVPPSMVNATVPVRVPAPGATGLTVAVKPTGWPATDGLAEDASVVVVSALLTCCV